MHEIPCPGCERGYPDDGRFALGRTLACTCGARVGRRWEAAWRVEGPPRFFADSMLGALARWLRTLGYDTAYEAEIADAELVRRGAEERRLVLTRDRGLAEAWWSEGVLLLRSEDPPEQLREVAAAAGLSADALFTRCTRCNLPLGGVSPAEVAERVPESVRAAGKDLRGCAGCGRVYWEGSHTARMRTTVARVLAGG